MCRMPFPCLMPFPCIIPIWLCPDPAKINNPTTPNPTKSFFTFPFTPMAVYLATRTAPTTIETQGEYRSSPLIASSFLKLVPKAVERLEDGWERLITFYQFPREHWVHLRTPNVVESLFAAVRLRTTAAKRFKRVENVTALIWDDLFYI